MSLYKTIILSIFIFFSRSTFSQLVADFKPDTSIAECFPFLQTFHDNSTGYPNWWLWDLGGGVISHNQDAGCAYIAPGFYSVTLIVSDGVSYDTITRTNLIEALDYPHIEFSYSNISIPAPLTVAFINNTVAGSGIVTAYGWLFENDYENTSWNPIHTYSSPGTYRVCLLVNNSYGCYHEECDSIIVSQPDCSAFFDLYPDTIPHLYYAVNMASGASPLSYFWDWGDGSIDTVPFPNHTYDTAGYYNICLMISDLNGCTDTFCNSYNLMKTASAIVEVNVIPPLNTGILDNHGNETVLIFPNPVSNNLTVKLSIQNLRADIRVFNTLGQLELSSSTTNQKTIFDVSALISGIHVIEVRTNNNISRQKFIKE